MTARFLRCRGNAMGGAGLMPPPPPSTAPRTWAAGNTGGTPAAWFLGVAISAAGTLVAGTTGGDVYRSVDKGATWQAVVTGATYAQAPAYGGGIFLLGGYNYGQAWASSNEGISWTKISTSVPTTNSTARFAYGNGVWVSCPQGSSGDTSVCGYSTDGGVQWRNANASGAPASFAGESLGFDGSNFFLLGYTAGNPSYIALSPDGVTWTAYPFTSGVTAQTYMTSGAGLYVVNATNSDIVISDSVQALLGAAPTALPKVGGNQTSWGQVAVLPEGRVVLFDATNGYVLWSLDAGATWVQDTPAWVTGSGDGVASWPVAIFGENVAAGLHNASHFVAVRGVNC